jgi:transposase, IS5 family
MLQLMGGQVESLFDELLPVEVRELPADLATLDRLLSDPRLLAAIEQAWEQTARDHGRPTIPMASFVRLMVVKQRTGWGYANPGPGGVGLAAPAPVLPAAADPASTGGVDGA